MKYPDLTFSRQNLDLPGMTQALAAAGCILIEGLFEPAALYRLATWAPRAFAQLDQQLKEGSLEQDLHDYFHLVVPHMINHLPSICFDRFAGDPEALWYVFLDSSLPELLYSVYQGHFLYSSLHAVIRRQSPGEPRWWTGFHQDGHFLNPDWNLLHCWGPLLPCGADAPGLELIPAGLKQIWPRTAPPERGAHYYDNRDLDYTQDILPVFAPEQFWTQTLAPGDVFIYDRFCLHRTLTRPGMTQTRYNLEMRFLPAVTLPAQIARLGFRGV
jgi:hypothetical protein